MSLRRLIASPRGRSQFNVDDLGFFASLKSDQRSLPGASNLFELRALVQFAFDQYDAERLERIWRGHGSGARTPDSPVKI